MASTYLTNTSVTPTNRYKYTFSFWVKRSKILLGATAQRLINVYTDSNNKLQIAFGTDDRLSIFDKESGATRFSVAPSMRFRDPNAWYHIVIAADTTQSTEADRMKVYVNGEIITAYESGNTYAGQNTNTGGQLTGSGARRIGANESAANHFDGLLSHFHFVDGTAYAASDFGSTDSTTGEWKINTSPSVTYGNNGYFILKDGNSVTDQSGNSNNWTVGAGTLTNTEDCPSNVFATFNSVIRTSGSFSQGNNTFTDTSNNFQTGFSSIGMANGQGKYYAEFKVASGGNVYFGISDYKDSGVLDRNQRGENRYLGEYANSYGYQMGGTFYYNGSSTGTGYDAYTTSNVIGVAVDMDNLKIYFHKDGVYQGSANPASNNGYTIVAPEGAYHMTTAVANSVVNANFGNGYFGTTAISSEGTNASGIGKFEYDVPTGYTALSTKGLNE